MLNINVTIIDTGRPKSQLKQKAKILWAVFTVPWAVLDIRVGRFGCSCGPFLTRTMGPFDSWSVLVISRCRLLQPWSRGCRKTGDDRAPCPESSSYPLPVDRHRRRTRTTCWTWQLAAIMCVEISGPSAWLKNF